MAIKRKAQSTSTTDERLKASLMARFCAGRAYRIALESPEVLHVAEEYVQDAISIEESLPMPALIEHYARLGAEAMLWVRLDAPNALDELARTSKDFMQSANMQRLRLDEAARNN